MRGLVEGQVWSLPIPSGTLCHRMVDNAVPSWVHGVVRGHHGPCPNKHPTQPLPNLEPKEVKRKKMSSLLKGLDSQSLGKFITSRDRHRWIALDERIISMPGARLIDAAFRRSSWVARSRSVAFALAFCRVRVFCGSRKVCVDASRIFFIGRNEISVKFCIDRYVKHRK